MRAKSILKLSVLATLYTDHTVARVSDARAVALVNRSVRNKFERG
jgi:hypothetical protein